MISTTYLVQMVRVLCILVFALSPICQSSAVSAQQPATTFISSFTTQQATPSTVSTQLEMVGYLPGTVWQVVANQRLAVALTSGDLLIIDIRHPAHPRIMSRLLLRTLPTGAGNGQTTVALVDHYLFLACADHCGDTSLFVINIAVPTTPVVVGKLKTGTTLSHITIHGDHLYGSLNGELAIIDIHEPRTPKLLGVQPLSGQFAHATDAVILEAANGVRYAFVTSLNGKLYIIDVTTPTAPQEVATYAPDQACINDVALLANSNQPRLYLTDCYVGLRVLDVTTPTQPQALTNYSFGQDNKAYAIMSADQRLLVTTDVSSTSAWDSTLHILDGTSGTLTEIGAFKDFTYAYAMAPVGQLLLLADVRQGIQFLDLGMPAAIQEVGRQLISDAFHDFASDGQYLYMVSPTGLNILDPLNLTASAYIAKVTTPYALTIEVNAGLALMTDAEGGLWLFNVQNPTQPTVVSHRSTPLFSTTEVVISGTLGSQATAFLGGIGCTPFGCQPSLAAVDLANLQQPTTTILLPDGRGISELVQVGNLLYLTTGSPSTLTPSDLLMLDITNPKQPSEVGKIALPAAAASMATTGHALYIALANTLQTYDITNPAAPRLTQTIALPRGFTSIAADNKLLYGKDGLNLTVLSLADPFQPIVQAAYALPSGGVGIVAANNILVDQGAIYVINDSLTVWRPQKERRGYVRDAWGEPYAGAHLYGLPESSTVASALTPMSFSGLTGSYGLPATMTGSYTVQAVVEGYSVWPPTHTGVTHDTAAAKDFYVLTQPVSVTVQPGASATLAYVDGRDLQTEAIIAAGTVSQPTVVQLTPRMAFDQTKRQFTGNAFALGLADASNGQPIDTLAQPITLTIHYSDQGRNATLDERSFQLMIEVAGAWQALPAATGADPITRDLANNAITVALTKPGRYAMFGIANQFYLPFIAQE